MQAGNWGGQVERTLLEQSIDPDVVLVIVTINQPRFGLPKTVGVASNNRLVWMS